MLAGLPPDAADRIAALPPAQQARALEVLRELDRRERQDRGRHFFPDRTHVWRGETFYARDLYPRHLELFRAGAEYRERMFRAANRVGKTVGGAFESRCHLTGDYPGWWEGRRFAGPIHAWAAGKTYETTRDIIQVELFGPVLGSGQGRRLAGTGMVPGALIDQGSIKWRQGVDDLLQSVRIRRPGGGASVLGLKAYQQGRGAFEGTARHWVWLDEEPPEDIYGEALTRTATTGGAVLITFTPLEGLSDVVRAFVPKEDLG